MYNKSVYFCGCKGSTIFWNWQKCRDFMIFGIPRQARNPKIIGDCGNAELDSVPQ